ncbi:MAG: 2-phospho-L-lactate guanylyltransferase [Acidimicrobiia bacterium]|nr:2-phospho-L-lactate guanylyltransferase [Acidimicrobiia bacterium]
MRRLIVRLSGVTEAAVLVPVKAFGQAKLRLEAVLGADERAELARRMAAHVLRAAAPLHAAVVCDDREVATWAEAAGAEVVWCPGTGLNGAVSHGVGVLADHGYLEVVVAHGDLPAARRFDHLTGAGGVTVVPDRRADGTNVLCVPAAAGFCFSYGAGSFRRHCDEARRLGLRLRVRHDLDLNWDVDLPEDLQRLPPLLRMPAAAGAGRVS